MFKSLQTPFNPWTISTTIAYTTILPLSLYTVYTYIHTYTTTYMLLLCRRTFFGRLHQRRASPEVASPCDFLDPEVRDWSAGIQRTCGGRTAVFFGFLVNSMCTQYGTTHTHTHRSQQNYSESYWVIKLPRLMATDSVMNDHGCRMAIPERKYSGGLHLNLWSGQQKLQLEATGQCFFSILFPFYPFPFNLLQPRRDGH